MRLTFATVVLLACAAPASAAFEPCSLLTKDEAAASLGEPVGGPEVTRPMASGMMPGGTASSCEYATSGLHRVHLNIYMGTPSSVAQVRQMAAIVCGSKEKVPGLGDMACWYNAKHTELQVFKGANLLTIEMSRKGDATEALKTVAKAALPRLP